VQKVYVDGKEFFGNDPKIATKNLTADMVDQIQVFDDMSEQARFTKIDDGSRTKSINIKLKKDKRKGDFGRAIGGVGTNSRYEGNFSFNHFRGDQRISLVGSANNTNKLSYTFNDFSGTQGSGGSQFSNGGSMPIINANGGSMGGISRPLSIGLNFNDTWGPKLDFRSSYFYSDNSSILEQNKFRRTSFPNDSASETNSYNNILNSNRAHRFNVRGEYVIDSMNSILYTANVGKQQYTGSTIDTSVTYSEGVYKYLAAKSSTDRHDSRDGITYSGELLYRKRFNKSGRTFTLGWRNGSGNNEADGNTRSPVTTYDRNGAMTSIININQQSWQENENTNNTVSASYTEPIGRNKLFEINYAYSGSANVSDKKIVLLGTGKIGRNTCKNLVDYLHTTNITLINRTPDKAIELADELGVQNASFEEAGKCINEADIVIVATNAEQPVIMKADLENSNPKILIDLSIPNNIDPSAKELHHITLVNVDDLSKINDATLQKRQAEVPKAKAIIAEYMAEFSEWHSMRKNVPVLKAVKQKLIDMHECNLFIAMHPNLGDLASLHNSSDSIQKVINNMALKMRQQRKPGCNYIEAINDFITSRVN